jgi:hypothetical protein
VDIEIFFLQPKRPFYKIFCKIFRLITPPLHHVHEAWKYMSRISRFHHEHMCVCKFVSIIVSLSLYLSHTHTLFLTFYSLFACRNAMRRKVRVRKNTMRARLTCLETDSCLSFGDINIGGSSPRFHTNSIFIYLIYHFFVVFFFNFCLWSKWQFCSAMSTS